VKTRCKYFSLFPDCIPVKGFARSIICDLGQKRFDYITNEMYDILSSDNKSIECILSQYGADDRGVISEWFNYLEEDKYIFICDEDELEIVQPLSTKLISSNSIDNAIIVINDRFNHDYDKISQILSSLGCVALQLYSERAMNLNDINEVLTSFCQSSIETIELVIKYHNSIDQKRLFESFNRVDKITLYNAPKNIASEGSEGFYMAITDEINLKTNCGFVGPEYFSLDTRLFFESLNHSNCLNKKVTIDYNGDIMNCPASPIKFGNIYDEGDIKEIIRTAEFTEMWNISKREVNICKICEFRYICSDCRIFTVDNDIFGKPVKCKYDPYKATWNN